MRPSLLYERFRNAPIRMKFLVVAILVLSTLFVGGIYTCVRSYSIASADHIETARGDFSNCYRDFTKFEAKILHLRELLQADYDTNELLTRMPECTKGEYMTAKQELQPMLYTLEGNSPDYSCRLYVNTSLDLLDDSSSILSIDNALSKAWGQTAMSGWGSWRFYSAGELGASSPALLAPLRSTRDYSSLVGLFRVDLDMGELVKKLTPIRSADYVSCLLQTAEGETIACGGVELDEIFLEGPEETLTGFGATNFHSTKIEKDTVFYQTLLSSGWRLVLVTHEDLLFSRLFPQYLFLSLFACLLALLGVLCAAPILNLTTSRIGRFYAYVQHYNRRKDLQELPPPLDPVSDDEIGRLIKAHNALLKRVDGLMKSREQKEQALRSLELSVLQAQINPHFLYNTLEAVIWMAKMNEPDKVDSTVRSLIGFYRLCLNKGQDVLPLSQELKMVENYFAIQSMRYEQQFFLSIDVPEAMQELQLPKITLQPLVENALLHGILESGKQEGFIKIFGREEDHGYLLCIADSGAHFSEEKLEEILSEAPTTDAPSNGEGYGLRNVEKRLRLFFKRDRVLYLDFGDPAYTCLCIFFPKEDAEAPPEAPPKGW